jgi:hypothetical protein
MTGLAATALLIVLRVDVRNVTGPANAGELKTWEQVTSALDEVNQIWSACGIRFVSRSAENVSAEALKVPYEPKGQEDLARLESALNPAGHKDSIPVTIAGPWNFYDTLSGFWLHGLGWSFYLPAEKRILRMGAMIGSQRLAEKHGGRLLGHEIGHALSLSHTTQDTLMKVGLEMGATLSETECQQARQFSETYLAGFRQDETLSPPSRVN